MRRPGRTSVLALQNPNPQGSRFRSEGGEMEAAQSPSAGPVEDSPVFSEKTEFLKFSRRSANARVSLSAVGGGPPVYALSSGALYGSETFRPKYVLTQIVVLQSAFYLLYALIALGALTCFVAERGDWMPSLPFTGEEAAGVSSAAAAFPDSAVLGGESETPQRSGTAHSANRAATPVGVDSNGGVSDPQGKSPQSMAQDGAHFFQSRTGGRYRGSGRGLRRAKILFETELYRFATSEGRILLLVLFLTSLAMSYLVFLVVQRTRKCLDFCFSIHFFHLLACWIFGGFPSNSSWWLCSAASATATTALSQYFCRKVEMQDIQLERPPAGHRRFSSEGDSITSIGTDSSDSSGGFYTSGTEPAPERETLDDARVTRELHVASFVGDGNARENPNPKPILVGRSVSVPPVRERSPETGMMGPATQDGIELRLL
ncbi:putative transmembrane protein [Toxoplasma gondii VAND]|uniref:Putative transmembrane protein n=1 Tax=Toxoplasma gondii VAND TaxID=933077 RepID=A0A086QL17_TOXGO|nr:putative transmembrane protein [Toxoplasma gondii VAND]